MPGKSDSYMWKNEVRTVSNIVHRNKLKMDWHLHVRPDSVKLLDENMNRTLSDMNHRNIFLDLSPKAKEIKAKINKWGLIKCKGFCRAKETINKREDSLNGRIFANGITNRGLRETTCTTQYRKKPYWKRWAEELNRHFPQNDIQMGNRYMKKYSTLLIIREIYIKTMRYYLIPVRMTIIKKSTNIKC